MAFDPMVRRLLLLRHGKSCYPDGVADPDRPLSERGVRDATAAGLALAELLTGTAPDLVLCSPACRTQQTLALVAQPFTPAPQARFEPVIYGAEVDELIGLLRTVPTDTATVLVIGHEPTMSEMALELAGPGSDRAALAELRMKYPTSGLAVLDLIAPHWADLAVAGAQLRRFLVPRG